MPIEIITSEIQSPVLQAFPYWSAQIPQDFVSVDTLNEYVKISKGFKFKLRAKGNAYIIFVLNPRPYYHIVIGEALQPRLCSTYNPVNAAKKFKKASTIILDENEFRSFWIKWDINIVYLGRENEVEPFLTWRDTHMDLSLPSLRIGFSTLEVGGTWIIDDSEFKSSILCATSYEGHTGTWTYANSGNVPPGAIPAGVEDDEPLYIARAFFQNRLIPGKLLPSHGCCYVTSNGRAYSLRDYEVLCAVNGEWRFCRGGDDIPLNALQSICRHTGEMFHIGRGHYNGFLINGKVFPESKLCYIGYDGIEYLSTEYEIFLTID